MGADMSDYYILSLAHTKCSDRVLTFWAPDDCGYAFRLEWAGRYTAERVAANPAYYDNGVNTLAVPCEAVEALAVPVGDVESRAIDRRRPGTDRVVRYEHLVRLKREYGCRRKKAATVKRIFGPERGPVPT